MSEEQKFIQVSADSDYIQTVYYQIHSIGPACVHQLYGQPCTH